MTAAILATARVEYLSRAKPLYNLKEMTHGKQNYYNDDKILHCQFVTQPLDKNH